MTIQCYETGMSKHLKILLGEKYIDSSFWMLNWVNVIMSVLCDGICVIFTVIKYGIPASRILMLFQDRTSNFFSAIW